MAGEFFFFFGLIIFLLWLWEKRKTRRRLADLRLRVRHIEELLLEICAYLEREAKKEPAGKEEGKQLDDGRMVKDLLTEEPVKEERAKEELASSSLVQEEKEAGREGETEREAEPAVETGNDRSGPGPGRGKGKTGEKKKITETVQVPERHRDVLNLFEQGLSVKDIARRTGMGQGEVQLIVDLYAPRK